MLKVSSRPSEAVCPCSKLNDGKNLISHKEFGFV
jgi:hypothetical protein